MSPFDPAVRRQRRRRTAGDDAPARGASSSAAESDTSRFFLYVEGPRDGDLLRVWARRVSPVLTRPLQASLVILGGRRPARALEHFRRAGGDGQGLRGLVVLDRDHHAGEDDRVLEEPGLELFTWSRRHIESYVLVRDAIRRVAAPRGEPEWVDRLIEDHVPPAADEAAFRDIDAKRLLGSKGALARELGQSLSPSAIARAMRPGEIHDDVHRLYDRIRAGLGLADAACEVVRRSTPRRS